MKCIIVIFLKDNKLLSHMDQMNEQNNSKNQKVHFYDQMRKMIGNFGSNGIKEHNTSSFQLTCIYNSLLMILLTPLKRIYLMLIWKYDMKKVHTYSVKSSLTLFYFSIHAIYNRVNRAQKQRLTLNSYIPGII